MDFTIGRECGKPISSPCCNRRSRNPASRRASVDKGGVLISPDKRTSVLSGFFDTRQTMPYAAYARKLGLNHVLSGSMCPSRVLCAAIASFMLAVACSDAGQSEDAANADVDATADAEVEAGLGDCRNALPLRCGDRLTHSTVTEGQPDEWFGYACTA